MKLRAARRALRVTGGTVLALAACWIVGAGYAGADAWASAGPATVDMLIMAALLVVVTSALLRRFQYTPPTARAQRVSRLMVASPALADIELSLAMVAGVFAALSATGGMDSPLYPLVYALLAFSATFQRWSAAWTTLGAVVLMEVAGLAHAEAGMARSVALHVGFACASFALHAVFLRSLVTRLRREHASLLRAALDVQRQSARDYRLIASPLGAESRAPRTRADEEEMLSIGAVAALQDGVTSTLDVLRRALGARTCALLWLDERTERIKVKEIVSESDELGDATVLPLAGALGAIVRDRSPLLLSSTKPGQIPYYATTQAMGAFVGVPVLEGPHLRGIVAADREEPFHEHDAALLGAAAEQVVQLVRSEQIFGAVERSKYEHERFYHASSLLCSALTLEQVMETAFDAARAIVDYDLAVITLYDPERRAHRVSSVRIPADRAPMTSADDLVGLEFRDNAGLASMVVKNKHYLPAGGEVRDVSVPVFTKKVRFRGAESLIVLPLLSADEAIGTFTLVSSRPRQFRKDARAMLGVIASQVAISLQNAQMYKKMETMATTDGLTGLTNHRTFQERFSDLLERSERHGHQAAVLLCDVDHFKKVNDTYGHPVGDEVLRQVARVLADAVRKIDIPARYGGEEFAVVLEATDLEGAVGLADRIRKDVGDLLIDSDKGQFQVKMSIGVAAFPADAETKEELIEKADMALYHAKETGRNRVVSFRAFDEARNKVAS